jgi:hypothetical protein
LWVVMTGEAIDLLGFYLYSFSSLLSLGDLFSVFFIAFFVLW